MTAGPVVQRSIAHVNIPCLDIQSAQDFYGALFGWTFRPNSENYVLFDDGGHGGGLSTAGKVSPDGGVLLFIQVEDIDATLEAVGRAGGSTVKPKAPVGGPGFFAVFRDPSGNQMGLYSES